MVVVGLGLCGIGKGLAECEGGTCLRTRASETGNEAGVAASRANDGLPCLVPVRAEPVGALWGGEEEKQVRRK
jgi:hypothetical protein